MRCKRVREQLIEFEEQPLTSEVAEHMNQCADCCQHRQQMETVRRLMSLKKYELPDSNFEERSALAIQRRIEELNRPSSSWVGSVWALLTNYPQPLFRYVLATTAAALLVFHFISMPQLTPIRPAEPVARSTPTGVPTPAHAPTTIPFEVYRHPAFAEFQTPSNRGPAQVEYGPREAVPVHFEY